MSDLLHQINNKTDEIRDLAFNKFPFTKVDRVNDLCDEILEIVESYTNQVVEELEEHTIEFETFGMCSDYVELSHAIEIIRRAAVEQEKNRPDTQNIIIRVTDSNVECSEQKECIS